MTTHLLGCPLEDSAVPASTCTPCMYIRKGIALALDMPLVDPRHEPGLASLIVAPGGVLFRTLRGWTGIAGISHSWPEVTTPGAFGGPFHVAYSTLPLPGRTR